MSPNKEPDESLKKTRVREAELVALGMRHAEARQRAWLEDRISSWPEGHGDYLEILIFGDFSIPQRDLEVPELGITIYKDPVEKSFVQALLVLRSRVTIASKTVEAIEDAARRINLLLGINTLVNWGNASVGWWSWVVHDTGGGVMQDIDHNETVHALKALLAIADPKVRRKIDAALFWIREPRPLLTDSPRIESLRIFSAYWNAFECLVDVIDLLRPMKKMTKPEKQAAIDKFLQDRDGKLTPQDVAACYYETIDPRFKAKAKHALTACFGDEAAYYYRECFELDERERRLYQIRNAIDHGDIDASDTRVLHMVEARLPVLWMIVWRIFGRIIPFNAPVDVDACNSHLPTTNSCYLVNNLRTT